MRRPLRGLLILASAAVLAACSSAAQNQPGGWSPSPANPNVEPSPGIQITPILPIPSRSGGGSGNSSGAPGSAGPGQSSGPNAKIDPLVVATKLTTPTGIAILPDGTALVGERTTGRIVQVQPVAGRPVPTIRTLTGLVPTGGGGLLDLALSPSYSQDNLIYAYITTRTDNRVVDFTLHGPVTPVLTGIPKGTTGNAGRIAFGPDGELYVATGDAGHPSLASNPRSLAGKILRIDDIGRAPTDNPTAGSPVFVTGSPATAGLCTSPTAPPLFAVNGVPGNINIVRPGASFGYPTPSTSGQRPIGSLPSASPAPGGCAVELNQLFVTSLTGQALLSAPLTTTGASTRVGAFKPVLSKKYGRLKTVVAAPDGALWITTSNRDGSGKPVAADERVIRYVPNASSGGGGSTL